MLKYRSCRKIINKFVTDQSGSIIPIFAVLAIVLIISAGAGVDYARAVNNREKLSHALDAAALALAGELSTSVMTDAEISATLTDSFSANLQSMGLKDAAVANLQHTVDPDNGTIQISSTVSVATQFLALGGIGPSTLPIGVKSEVNYSKFDVELALVLDITGSMRNDIGTLKQASTDLLNILIPEGTAASDSKVRISVVPYSQGVNLGSYASTVTNGSSYNNCVTERAGEAKYTDDPYNYSAIDPNLVSDTFFGGGTGNCPRGVEVLPLTNDRNDIETTISKLDDGGYTTGQTGIQWGWYTISPNWDNLWPTASEPAPYSDDEVLKFAVIMTDGDNNRYYDLDAEVCGWKYTWSGWQYICETKSGWSEMPENEGYNNESSTRAKTICTAMQDSGITIYSIYFGTDSSSAGARVMSDCASENSTFYMASSSQELINAFGNIAKKIQSIYLAK